VDRVTAAAPTMLASSSTMAKIGPRKCRCSDSRCAIPPASLNCPTVPVLRAAQSAVIISAAAPMITTTEPSTVSTRS
jgi:hypothetical protein